LEATLIRRLGVLVLQLGSAGSAQQPTAEDFTKKVDQLNIGTASLADAVRLFGEPAEYLWGDAKFQRENLPSRYLARYPGDFMLKVQDGLVVELRLKTPAYKFQNAIGIGSSLEEVLAVLGSPKAVVEGGIRFLPGVLYKDFNGLKGVAYYSSQEKGVIVVLLNNRVAEMTLAHKEQSAGNRGPGGPADSSELLPFDNLCDIPGMGATKQAGRQDLSGKPHLLPTLTFNQRTVWPEAAKMPRGVSPDDLLKRAMDPGLGVRKLHQEGITGKGVAVAIIDQPMFTGHPEFAGKIAAYHDVGTGQSSSMHGPAVASLLVGSNTGTAPGAQLYFAAAPWSTRDAGPLAKALDWVRDQNRNLPEGRKIRVVSVSGAPSGPGSLFNKNNDAWDKAVKAAESEGILVLDLSLNRTILAACWFEGYEREDPAKCRPGFPGLDGKSPSGNRVLVPASPRTTAEEYVEGQPGYQFTGRGGASWTVPYAAGILALGWQLRPELSAKEMVNLLFESAWRRDAETRVIDPPAFIRAVQGYRR
jgi:hypothetical protein